jgi:aminopeptidase N
MAARSWSTTGADNAAVYVRGATVLHMLRVYLGDDVFDRNIRTYVDEYQDKLVESDDLRRVMEDGSGTHLGWLFDQWVHGQKRPSFASSSRWAEGVLTVELEQTDDGPSFSAPVEIEIGTDEEVVTRRVWIDGGTAKVVVDLEQPPRWVIADPRGGVLATWKRTQDPAAWAAAVADSKTPYARLIAMEALGAEHATVEGVVALRDVLANRELAPRFRQHAARALAKLKTPAAVAALTASLTDPSAQLRETVVEGLAGAPDGVALTAPALDDSDMKVRAAALRAQKADGVKAARKALKTPPTPYRRDEQSVALTLLGEHGSASDMSKLLRFTAGRYPRGIRRDAGFAALRRLNEEDEDAKRRRKVAAAIEPWLNDDDIRTRQAGIDLLGQLGDDESAAILQAWASASTIPGHAESARNAAARIRNRTPSEEKPSTEDAKRTAERIEALEKRLKRLEDWR